MPRQPLPPGRYITRPSFTRGPLLGTQPQQEANARLVELRTTHIRVRAKELLRMRWHPDIDYGTTTKSGLNPPHPLPGAPRLYKYGR